MKRTLAIALLATLGSCASEAPERPAATPATSADTPTSTSTSTSLEAERSGPTEAVDELRRIETPDGERQFLLYAPPNFDATPRPIVIVLHGHGGSSEQASGAGFGQSPTSVWHTIADREHLVLAFPDGAVGSDDAQGWNDCRRDARANPETDDVRFLADMIDDAQGVVAIDPSSVFFVGVSNGGFMSMRMAVERPDLVTAAAAIVASMASDTECDTPAKPVSVLLMNGTADPLVNYEGGQVPFRRGGTMSTAAAIELWRDLADAQPAGAPESFPDLDPDDGSTVRRTRWSGAAEVWLYTIDGGGHNEPSIAERYRPIWTDIVGPQNHDVESAEEIWSFFVEASS